MEDLIELHDQFYILATSSRLDDRTRVLKDGDTFAVFDRHGDIHPMGLGEQGLYHEGTRHLSRLDVRFGGERPLLLSSTVRDDNGAFAVDLANPDLRAGGTLAVAADTVHVHRAAFLWRGTLYLRFRVHNFALHRVEVPLRLRFGADFVDIFEVRGIQRARRGDVLDPEVGEDTVMLRYSGLDGRLRRTRLRFGGVVPALSRDTADYRLTLEPKADVVLSLTVSCQPEDGPAPAVVSWEAASNAAAERARTSLARRAHLYSSNEQVNDWLNRSAADFQMMLTETPHGPYPYAGIPWYSTVFGRDGIISAFETLWLDGAPARGVLQLLAATQARDEDASRDAEPGKIVHEMRRGEMAALREIPFGRYYGTVDATPLFIVLAGAYWERTGDRAFIERLWPHIEAALAWIDRYGDLDGDGFVEYRRCSADGLANQGWKDSWDSVFHADGSLAEGRIALCEVQAYVHAAWRAAADLATALGDATRAADLRRRAERLEQRFDDAFWADDLGTYVLALDETKRACRVRTSNAGHALFGGIARPERAAALATTLLGDDAYSGWGIRTVAVPEVRYNPMAYHNGSVWPHDNALIAWGFSRYGLKDAALKVLTGFFESSLFLELRRLPELFCGFPRRPGEGPTLYPVACSPQAWAVAAPFLLLQACLGLDISAPDRAIRLRDPRLPPFIEALSITGLEIAGAIIDLGLRRQGDDVAVNVVRHQGNVDVVIYR